MSRDRVHNLFRKLDSSGDGQLSKEEVKVFFKCFSNPGIPVTDEDIVDYFQQNNKDGDDKISFDEFWAVFQKKDIKKCSAKDLEGKFKQFDTSGDGFLDEDEFVVLLSGVEGFSPDMAEEELAKVDKDSDGKVSYKEYMKCMGR